MLPYLFVIIPFAVYLPMFGYETLTSLNRLGKKSLRRSYPSATWEITHTFLIIGITNFIWLFSDIATEVAKATFLGLILVGFWFLLRALLYLYLFLVKDNTQPHGVGPSDVLFGAAHLGMLSALIYTFVQAIQVMMDIPYSINSQFIPFMWPGLILLVVLGTLPIMQLYRTKK